VSRDAFAGARFGGLVAASVAADHREAPLALIEPAVEAARYFRDAWRATLIRDVQAGTSERARGQGLAEALSQSETIDMLGYSFCRRFYESAKDRTLVGELQDASRRVLVVQLGRETAVRGDIEAARDTLEARGSDVDVECITDSITWWFPPSIEAKQPKRRGLVGLTGNWLATELGAVAQ
jgi:hypothetical protein